MSFKVTFYPCTDPKKQAKILKEQTKILKEIRRKGALKPPKVECRGDKAHTCLFCGEALTWSAPEESHVDKCPVLKPLAAKLTLSPDAGKVIYEELS